MAGSEEVFRNAMNEGHSAAWDQDWGKAAVAYKKALDEFPEHPKALNSLALALFQFQSYEKALEVYQHVSQISPDDPIPLEKIAQLSERLGDLKGAIDKALAAAKLFLDQKNANKAVENWVRVTQLDPEHIVAHSRLAMIHERLGHKSQAATEYMAVASLVQRSGNMEKTFELMNKAVELMPKSPEINQAMSLLKSGQLLPKPARLKGGTGPIMMASVKKLDVKTEPAESSLDPVAESSKIALTKLAEILFEYSDESDVAQARRGLQAIVKGTGQLSLKQAEQTKIVMHLGQAIDARTKNQDSEAADELEHALTLGFDHPALFFELGALRAKQERVESALRHLQHAVRHKDLALGARLLMSELMHKQGRTSEAALEYLEALKLADAQVVPEEVSDELRQLYEPLVEAVRAQSDDSKLDQICKNVRQLLMQPHWREYVQTAREQLPAQVGDLPVPLAEVLIQTESGQVLEEINYVHQLARQGYLRSAMDQAFHALKSAPTYLPLHTLMGELLIQEGHTTQAINKFSVVARAYSVRGETVQATKMLRRIIQLAPMDLSARTNLIEQLAAHGQTDEAVNEYMDLSEIYYRLAELDMARKTYTTALRLVQQTNADRDWNVRILRRMADIDMQRLDWKQALRVYEQIRTLRPDDDAVRKSLVDLNLRLGQSTQAISELENYLTHLEINNRKPDAIVFLEDLVKENGAQVILRRALAQQYRDAGRIEEAISQLDAVGETLLESGNRDGAIEAIHMIIGMNPPNLEDYQQLLVQLQQGG
ncbi:MAG: tetratricopeptide repeat protein [Anaerolineales bacterium]|nr:tetratricopeptide repeat protein [Anaerolineales bacterium]